MNISIKIFENIYFTTVTIVPKSFKAMILWNSKLQRRKIQKNCQRKLKSNKNVKEFVMIVIKVYWTKMADLDFIYFVLILECGRWRYVQGWQAEIWPYIEQRRLNYTQCGISPFFRPLLKFITIAKISQTLIMFAYFTLFNEV